MKISKEYKIFLLFLSAQFIFWALMPALFVQTIPLDAAEGVSWGYEWQWGYYKHPPLAAWLSNLAVVIQGSPGFVLYAFAQISMIATFIAVWKLTKSMLNETIALISVVSLSTIYYYTFPTFNFNPNIISFPLLALLIYYIYKISIKYSFWDWGAIGLLSGLSILAKYEGAFIFLPAFIFILINKNTRKQLISWGFLFAVIVYFVLITPHIVWLFNNDFGPFYYAFGKTDPDATAASIWDHIHWPIDYLVNIILPAIPIIIISFILSIKTPKDTDITHNFKLTSFTILVLLGSFLFTFMLTVTLGIHVNPYWTMTFYSFIMTSVIYFLRPKVVLKNWRTKLVITVSFLALIIPSIATAVLTEYLPPMINGRSTLIQFPAKKIAMVCKNKWELNSKKQFTYVGGFAPDFKSYVNAYLKDRPTTYEIFGDIETPWVNKSEIEKYGAVFVWGDSQGNAEEIHSKVVNEFSNKMIYYPGIPVKWLKGSILEQCSGHPFLKEKVLYFSKYISFLGEHIDPLTINIIVLLPEENN